MTFNPAALAIDGARVESSLVRLGFYVATRGEEGVAQKDDLKVAPLSVPGPGLQIAPGGALILNRYLDAPDQTYVVSNPTPHVLGAIDMPASNPSAQHYIVAITVGDPEFSQVGHPWMPSIIPPGEAEDFQYIRPFIIPVANGATTLDVDYPALPLARLEIPANTTTITDVMIKDLRQLPSPRTKLEMNNVPTPGAVILNGLGGVAGAWQRWPDNDILTVKVPSWAVKAKITGFVEGPKLLKAGRASLRVNVQGSALVGEITNVDESAPSSGSDRRSYNVGGTIDVTSKQGQTVTFIIQGTPFNTAAKGMLTTDSACSAQLQVYFEEQPS